MFRGLGVKPHSGRVSRKLKLQSMLQFGVQWFRYLLNKLSVQEGLGLGLGDYTELLTSVVLSSI